jgi:surface antigen
MMKFANILLQKRRVLIEGTIAITVILLISLAAPLLQARHASIAAQARASYADQGMQGAGDSPNEVSNMLSQMTNDVGPVTKTMGLKTLSGVVGAVAGVAHFDKNVVHGAYVATAFTSRGIGKGAAVTAHGIGTGTMFAVHGIGAGFAFTGHTIGNVFGFFSGITHVNAIIRPQDNTPTPVITQLRIQQAALIQSDTTQVSIAPAATGAGGLCDNGNGNGGYPLQWCNASMDSVATVSYTGDRINRECTSYAYWYFTSVEGHADFHATGNAKSWAATTNYSTGSLPAVGAIAVETAGAYGHVAIVQALPGQTYAGQTVPAGYALVSEMNYDWNGHFRYSYSPLGKFSAYIYP